jgi:hypothetical protein
MIASHLKDSLLPDIKKLGLKKVASPVVTNRLGVFPDLLEFSFHLIPPGGKSVLTLLIDDPGLLQQLFNPGGDGSGPFFQFRHAPPHLHEGLRPDPTNLFIESIDLLDEDLALCQHRGKAPRIAAI